MNSDALAALNRAALDPTQSVIVEAVAGSGKTWLLVSRIVRLLVENVSPSEILAITFTRKAAQEMASRLREWLFFLATADEAAARDFLTQREVPDHQLDAALARSRHLYEAFLTAQPPITIATFHSWFLQILKRAPLEAGAVGEVNLVEQTGALLDEAWQRFGLRVQREPQGDLAQMLDRLFRDYGLDATRRLLRNFVMRRAEWWAYTREQREPVAWALKRIASEMNCDPAIDVVGAAAGNTTIRSELGELAALLARNGVRDSKQAADYAVAAAAQTAAEWFEAACRIVLTQKGVSRIRKTSSAQAARLGATGEARLIELQAKLSAAMLDACEQRANQACYRANEAALACGVAMLDAYQAVKSERQSIDYADIEWRAYSLVSVSEHAAYMQYKLDARYRHILLDEFQDTNPLQWLTLKSWFAAAAEADSRPVVFLVGDPKQSIYRFRRAEARLFAQAAAYLEDAFGARKVVQQQSRRCAPAVIEIVNTLFSPAREPEFQGFATHTAHFQNTPGRIEVLPLSMNRSAPDRGSTSEADLDADPISAEDLADPTFPLFLRNPLEHAFDIEEDRRRKDEALMLAERISQIVGRWKLTADDGSNRLASYRDIMILVKRRTHLATYEQALRRCAIPFVTSRHGGLLGTLEAQDLVALLDFIVSPFADLRLAHALRSPIFSCSDEDLMAIAAIKAPNWWGRLCLLAAEPSASAELKRAQALLSRWLAQSDGLPVHDQLDRIYFEGDVIARYGASVPDAMRAPVIANLHAFMQRALDTDAGRYPSLPRFLHELVDLADAAAEEAPDEGIVGDAGDALRIYTVHGAKGLEAPIVWLLNVAAGKEPNDSYGSIVDWPPEADAPTHFSVCTRKGEHGSFQRQLKDAEDVLSRREELNLLYVAMTRARQALLVSGCEGAGRKSSWYEKVRYAVRVAGGIELTPDDLEEPVVYGAELTIGAALDERSADAPPRMSIDPRLNSPLPAGVRHATVTGHGARYGTSFHALMEYLTAAGDRHALDPVPVRKTLRLSERDFESMWDHAQRLLGQPELLRFFDSKQFTRAANEVPYATRSGELRRIDRLVEIDDELWILDYKTGALPQDAELLSQYEQQMREYLEAMSALAAGKRVRAMLLFANGAHREVTA